MTFISGLLSVIAGGLGLLFDLILHYLVVFDLVGLNVLVLVARTTTIA
jgi:hypothetical protein